MYTPRLRGAIVRWTRCHDRREHGNSTTRTPSQREIPKRDPGHGDRDPSRERLQSMSVDDVARRAGVIRKPERALSTA